MILTIAHNYMVDARKCHRGALRNDGLRGKSGLLTASGRARLFTAVVRCQFKMFMLVGRIFGIS